MTDRAPHPVDDLEAEFEWLAAYISVHSRTMPMDRAMRLLDRLKKLHDRMMEVQYGSPPFFGLRPWEK